MNVANELKQSDWSTWYKSVKHLVSLAMSLCTSDLRPSMHKSHIYFGMTYTYNMLNLIQTNLLLQIKLVSADPYYIGILVLLHY